MDRTKGYNYIAVFIYCTVFNLHPVNCETIRAQEIFRKLTPKMYSDSSYATDLAYYSAMFPDCLMHLINYQNVDLAMSESPYVPIAITNYRVLTLIYRRKVNRLFDAVKQVRIFPNSNFHFTENTTKYCENFNPDYRCFDFPNYDLTSVSKPWRCEIHLYLFPPGMKEAPEFFDYDIGVKERFMSIPWQFHRFWHHSVNVTLERDVINGMFDPRILEIITMLIVTRKQYHILVPTPNQGTDYVKTFIASMTIFRNDFIRVDYTYTPSNKEIFVVGKSQELIWIPRNPRPNMPYGFLSLGTWPTSELIDHMIETGNRKYAGNIYWLSYTDTIVLEALQYAQQNNIQQEYSLLLNLYKVFGRDLDHSVLDNMRLTVDLMLIQSALVNTSGNNFLTSVVSSRDNPRRKFLNAWLEQSPGLHIFVAGKYDYFPFYFHPTDLKFVSCAPVERSSLIQAAKCLVEVYDLPIWLGILSALIICGRLSVFLVQNSQTLGLKCVDKLVMLRFNSVFNASTCFTKVLVEQGEPISALVISIHGPMRILFGAFLLVGIVLSNLFKNENISQITLPRQPIPFDTVDSLRSHGFTLYTRGTGFGVTALYRDNPFGVMRYELRTFYKFVLPQLPHGPHEITNLFQSELYAHAKGQTSTRQWKYPLISFPDYVTRLLNFTKLVPNWTRMLLYGDYMEYDVLKNCSHNALFVPDGTALALYYRLKKEKKNAFIGENLDLRKRLGLGFFRWMNPSVLKRLNGLYAGGLLDWWTKMLVDFMARVKGGSLGNTIEPFKASSIQGNISVVFVVYIVGILISMYEVIYLLGKYLIRTSVSAARRVRIRIKRYKLKRRYKKTSKIMQGK